jgi:hypothetical protein
MPSLENLQCFNGFLLFAALGLDVGFTRHSFNYQTVAACPPAVLTLKQIDAAIGY